MRLSPGTSVGPYIVGEPIGSGGMGDVYRARDPRLGRDVAIKVLNAAPDADRLARFEREARATALLAHSNILTIFDVGTHDGAPFLVCELLEGETLRQRLASGALDADAALALSLQLARGVAAAHALRNGHRDLQPENLLVTRDGTLKILDFGLAKLESHPLTDSMTETLGLSSPGMLIGTPGYMAPEQVRGALVDERTDIFAVGTILFEMLTGSNPFARATAAETMAAILHEDVALRSAELPAAAAQLVERCLQKQPDDRFHSVSELVAALDAARARIKRPLSALSGEAGHATSIAVLPFLDMSAARDQDYLCDGIAEELINALSHVDGLRVAARSSSFQFKSSATDARAVGARLGVDTVLEGGVRKSGDRLRVTVQLVDVADGYQRWSHRFDGTIEDVFDIQDQIAESVATALRGILSGREKNAMRRLGTEAEAYECYLRGRQMLHVVTASNAYRAREMFARAIEIDAKYAPAYAGLAQLHGWEFEWWGGGEAAAETADQASRKALELAPQLSEAHAARGAVLALRRRYDEAEAAFEEAIRLNPNSFEAHYFYARAAFAAGKIERSAELFRRGGEIQPEDFQCPVLMSQSLKMLGRKAEAVEANREGIRRAERWLELDPSNVRALSLGASALTDDSQPARALEWSARAVALAPDDVGVNVNAACTFAKLGRKEEALACLERTFARGFGKRDWIEHDPDYDSLRDDPRFQAMLDKLS